jgi:hypothetical protein
MNVATRSRPAWGIAIGSIVCAAASMLFLAVVVGPTTSRIFLVISLIATTAYRLVGATIAARTGNAIGWALLSVIAVWAVAVATEKYATYSFATAPIRFRWARSVAWGSER